MKVGLIGLGKMGSGVAHRLLQAGNEVIGFDFSKQACDEARAMGATIAGSVSELAQKARIMWLLVPAGDPVDSVLDTLLEHARPGDIIVDGGNSNFHNSIRRAQRCKDSAVYFIDCGTSGGVFGKEHGFSLMVGGDKKAYDTIEPLLEAVAASGGYGYVGPSGAGHYVKMVHNGIEYALLQAYAEGFHLLKEGSFKQENLDLQEVTRIWQHGSVIRSFILDLAHGIFKEDQKLDAISGEVQESGMGLWTAKDAHEHNVPVKLLDDSLAIRKWSRESGGNYGTKVVAMFRNAFGGHAVTEKK